MIDGPLQRLSRSWTVRDWLNPGLRFESYFAPLIRQVCGVVPEKSPTIRDLGHHKIGCPSHGLQHLLLFKRR